MSLIQSVAPDESFVANENLGATLMPKDPDPVHVLRLQEQLQNRRNIIGSRHSEVVVGPANQLRLAVPEEFAEGRRNLDEFSFLVYDGDEFRFDPRMR